MLDDPDLDAIWFARGGYGCVQLVEDLCWEGFRAHPKWLIGFSDTTTLLSAVLQQGYACLHATMPQQIYAHPEAHTDSLRTLKNQLRGVPSMYSWRGEVCGKLPNESGPLVGGNLSLIYNQMGPCQVDTRGAWIYLEEVAEYYYHLDRMLWGLRRSGFFSGSLGILAGGFSQLQDNDDDPWEGDVQALLEQHAQAVGLPLITHFPAGHQSPNWALPLGRKAHFEPTSDMVKLHIH